MPAVCELGSYVFQVGIPHVVAGEEEDVLVFVCELAHDGEELLFQDFALFLYFREVDDLCAFGFGHFGVLCAWAQLLSRIESFAMSSRNCLLKERAVCCMK